MSLGVAYFRVFRFLDFSFIILESKKALISSIGSIAHPITVQMMQMLKSNSLYKWFNELETSINATSNT